MNEGTYLYLFVAVFGVLFTFTLLFAVWRTVFRAAFRNHKHHGSPTHCRLCYASSHQKDYTCRWPLGNRTGKWEYNTDPAE